MALVQKLREEDLDEDQIEKLNLLVAHFKSSINPTLKRKSGRQEVKPKKQGGGRGGEWGLGGDGVSPEEKEGLVVRVAFDFENEDFEESTEVSRVTCMQFLIFHECDVEKATAALTETIKWRVNNQPHLAVLESPTMGALRRKEMMWWKHRDIHGRPALILFGGRRRTDLETPEQKIRHFYWVVESAATLSHDGQFVIIFDLFNLGFANVERETVRETAPLFAAHFPERLQKLVFVFTPYIFYAGWQMLSMLLDAQTLSKVTITSDNGAEALLPHFTPETLPRRYGGECDDEVLDDDSFILTNADFLSKERAPTKEEKEREEREKEREEEEAKETASAGWFW